jgi:glycosyltransferase involved in cell wall biosynthesis
MGHLVIVTDAWMPQVNGVVRTLSKVMEGMRARGRRVTMITPQDYRTVPCPTYPEIRLSLTTRRGMSRRLETLQPAYIHIATEGPLGILARRACLKNGWPFTTSFHTRFPEYVRERVPVPLAVTYSFLRRFHASAQTCLVPTQSIKDELAKHGVFNTTLWTRGVDRNLFYPRPASGFHGKRPVFVCVGRVAPEKNLDAFLELDLPGTKLIIGDGPDLPRLQRRFPDALFLGKKLGVELAEIYAQCDVFVFPSRTDTFGLVLLEAIASGLPVAAFPVPGPIDVIGATRAGALSTDLRQAALAALVMGRVDPEKCLTGFTWERCVDIFESILAELPPFGSAAQSPTVLHPTSA